MSSTFVINPSSDLDSSVMLSSAWDEVGLVLDICSTPQEPLSGAKSGKNNRRKFQLKILPEMTDKKRSAVTKKNSKKARKEVDKKARKEVDKKARKEVVKQDKKDESKKKKDSKREAKSTPKKSKYSGDPNTGHSNNGTIRLLDFY